MPNDRVYSAAEMRELDRRTIASGVRSGVELMESAGAAVAAAARELAAPGRPVLVLCGRGNNGGDGLVAARLLLAQGVAVRLVLACPLDAYRGDAATMAGLLPPTLRETAQFALADEDLTAAGVVVDALLGTGFSGALRPPYAAWIAAVNRERARRPGLRVVAVDLPSGLDADAGVVAEAAIRADVTVTFHGRKQGMTQGQGPEYCGEVRVADIGIPY